jgi:predicted nucleic acid-binding protein
VLPGKRRYRKVFALYTNSGLGFADCYHAILLGQLRLPAIFSFDTDFDGLPGIQRRES